MDTTNLIEIITRAGLEWREYSGRGMGGVECVGVPGEPLFIIADVMRACRSLEEVCEFSDALDRAREDTMGNGAILYFPRHLIESNMADR